MLYSRHAVSAGTYVRGATVGGAGVGGSVGSTTAPEPGDAAAHSRAHRGNNIVETVLESGGCEERCVQQEYVKVWCVGFLVCGVLLCDGNNCTVWRRLQLCLQKEVVPPAGTHFQGDFIHDLVSLLGMQKPSSDSVALVHCHDTQMTALWVDPNYAVLQFYLLICI